MIGIFQTRNRVLCPYNRGLYGFIHRTFLEYLCAVQTLRSCAKDRNLIIEKIHGANVLRHCKDDVGHEVIHLLTTQFQPQFAHELIEVLVTAPVEAYRRSVRFHLAFQCLAEPARLHPPRKRPGHAQRCAQDTNQALPRCARDAKWRRLSVRWSPSRNSRIRLLRPRERTAPMTGQRKRCSATFRQFGSVTRCAECLVDKQLLASGFVKRAFLKLPVVISHQKSAVVDTLDDIVLPRPKPSLEFLQWVYLDKGYDTLWLLWGMLRRHYNFHNRTCGEGTKDLRSNSKNKVRRSAIPSFLPATFQYVNRSLTIKLQNLLLGLTFKLDGFTRAKVSQVRACLMLKSLLSIANYKMRASLRVRRWPVERTHSWTDCFQHSLIRWETPNPIISRNKQRNLHRRQRRCLGRREVNARSVGLYFSLARAVESDSVKFSGQGLEETLANLPRQRSSHRIQPWV
jgi:hypothetical protein